MEDVWTLIQFSTSGAFGIMVLLFYFVAIIQLCRAKFFFLEPTDTFLFYYCFILGLITTTSHFVDFNMLWNMEHSLELLLQVIFCFIFALIIDPNKRIFLFLHLFYLAATLVIVIFVVQTILVSLLSDWRVGNDWKCSGYLGIIVPGASFLFSGILAIFAIVATKAAQTKARDKSNSNSSNQNSSFSKLRIHSDQGTPRFIDGQNKDISKPLPPCVPSPPAPLKRQNVQLIKTKNSAIKLKRTNRKKTDTKERIAQLIRDYYSSSKRELQKKRSQVLALIFMNTASIVVQFSLILFLIMTGTDNFSQVSSYEQCHSRFDFKLGWIIFLNVMRALVDYMPISLVYYFTYWRDRKAVRSDDQSSIDIMLSSSSENGRLQESLLPQRDQNQVNHDLYDSSGEDLVDWVTNRETNHFSGDHKRIQIASHRQHHPLHPHLHHPHPHHPHEQEKYRSVEQSTDSNQFDTLMNRISSDDDSDEYTQTEKELGKNDSPLERKNSTTELWS